jgi:hypothetical protein
MFKGINMTAYTMISDKTLLGKANKDEKINDRDLFCLEKFGSRVFTKPIYLLVLEEFIRNEIGFGSKGGKPGCEKRTALQHFAWWEKRGAIFSIT